jgi:hypothetical protein
MTILSLSGLGSEQSGPASAAVVVGATRGGGSAPAGVPATWASIASAILRPAAISFSLRPASFPRNERDARR